MKSKALILVVLAGAGLWYWSKRAKTGMGLGADGKPVEIGRVGSDITSTDTRGDAIAKGIAALLGDPSAQGSIGYSDNEIDLTFTKGVDVASGTFGPRLTANPYMATSYNSAAATQERWLVSHLSPWMTSSDPLKREAARMFSWSSFGSGFSDWVDKFYEILGF